MNLLDRPCFDAYTTSMEFRIPELIVGFQSQDLDLGYNIKASSVYSSNIEGNSLDLNSYMNLKMKSDRTTNKEVKEIDDLVTAYEYARTEFLSEKAFLGAHRLLSKTILIKSKQGRYRQERMGVFSDRGLVYLAVEEEFVDSSMKSLFEEMKTLLNKDLALHEVFYFASLIHLRFVHIHPFSDGNGRAARLLEKWFLSQKIGPQYWGLLSEKNYRSKQQEYYNNINIGVNFYALEYERCLPFLLMLPKALEEKTL